jgi:hypothetical protein
MMWLAMVVPMHTANWNGVTAHQPLLPADQSGITQCLRPEIADRQQLNV